ncbi:MAG: hypothetical protein GX347_07560 [Epulopiscium sp.]|nr:hypothetical protein [Candidatus Epulonipiscium sp.]
MKFQIRQKIFSFRDRFTIQDEFNQPQYIVEGKFFSFGNKLTLYNMQQEEQIYIEQKLFKFLPEYYFYQKGRYIAKIKKEISFLKPKFYIESIQGYYEILGNIFAHDFQILKNNQLVCTVNKSWFSFTDTYGVEIKESEDPSLILAFVIVLDQIYHENHNTTNVNNN